MCFKDFKPSGRGNYVCLNHLVSLLIAKRSGDWEGLRQYLGCPVGSTLTFSSDPMLHEVALELLSAS